MLRLRSFCAKTAVWPILPLRYCALRFPAFGKRVAALQLLQYWICIFGVALTH